MGLGVLAFVVALLVSIMLHEAGHLLTAKKFGMKATQYFVGFGPTLWSFRRGETEYGVKAIPAGGFVKIVGMTDLEEVDPVDEPRSFWRQPPGRRAIVLAAGSFTHFVLGAVLVFVSLVIVGFQTPVAAVSTVSPCVTIDPLVRDCTAADPESPAQRSGLQPGDRFVSFNGKAVGSWNEFTEMVRGHGGSKATVVVERDGAQRTLTIDIVRALRESRDKPGELVAVGVVGITPVQVREREGVVSGATRTVSAMGELFYRTGEAIVRIPAEVPNAVRQAFSDEQRPADKSLTGIYGAARLSGDAVSSGAIGEFLGLMAGLNIFIGVLNLLPLLPLDGGHLAILGFEQIRSVIARLRGRRDPGRVDIRKLLPAAYLVIVFFAGLTLLLLYSDIVNPVTSPF